MPRSPTVATAGRQLVDEWSSGAPAFEAMVAEKPHRWWGLVYDVLVHEHDLRGAVGSTPDEVPDDAVEVAALPGSSGAVTWASTTCRRSGSC